MNLPLPGRNSTNTGDFYFDKVIIKDATDSTLAGSCVQDSKTGDIILKLANAGNRYKFMKINLSFFRKIIPNAERTVLTGEPEEANSFENPQNIIPVQSAFRVGKKFDYTVPATSLTVIRIKTKQ